MSNRRPEYIPGSFYHIYNRGAHQKTIFKDPANYSFVIEKIKQYSIQFHLSVIAYCLMPNHYHLLIRQDGEYQAGLLPQRVFNSYTKAFNNTYSHSGTLFQGNYKIKLIQEETYLVHLCRYIHGNPVKDGLVSDPEDWIYSNYQEFVGLRNGLLFYPEFINEFFDNGNNYRKFVMDDLTSRDLPEGIKKYLLSLENN